MATRPHSQRVNEESLRAATGRGWQQWYEVMDAAGADGWTHNRIAAWLVAEHAVEPWWAQGVTIAYEQERGIRVPGQRSDGSFGVTASKAVRADQPTALDAAAAAVAQEWGQPASRSAGNRYPSLRWSLPGGERIELMVDPTANGRTRVSLGAENLPGPELTEQWRARLKQVLAAVAAGLDDHPGTA